MHLIIQQLVEWGIGPKIINYVINYLTNQKIAVRIGAELSTWYPLHNGIPQGSPLSGMLFLIAYNKLCKIISLHKQIDFCSYADDFNLIIQHSKKRNPTVDVERIFQQI